MSVAEEDILYLLRNREMPMSVLEITACVLLAPKSVEAALAELEREGHVQRMSSPGVDSDSPMLDTWGVPTAKSN
jgi:hypothetical protein